MVVSRTGDRLPALHESWLPKEHPLHRPRHGRRQRTALVCALVFLTLPITTWLLGARPEQLENRPPAPVPDRLGELGPWAAEHLPFRGAAVRAVNAISEGVFGEPAPLDSGPPRSPVGSGSDQRPPPQPDENAFPRVIEGDAGWLYLGHDVAYPCTPRRDLGRVIAGLQRWRQVVEASGRRFELVIAPDKSTAEPANLPDHYAGQECAGRARREFWHRLPPATGAIDLRGPLREAAERAGHPVYHDIDTHWTHEGGLAMVRQLAERIEPGVSRTWAVRPSRSYPHTADIPDLLGQQRTVPIQAYALAPDGGPEDAAQFRASDFHQPLRLTAAPRAGMVQQPTRLVGDSFSQFASPYLAATFTDVAIAHPEEVPRRPDEMGAFLAEGQVVAFELSERFVSGGRYDLLDPAVADRVGAVLAAHPPR